MFRLASAKAWVLVAALLGGCGSPAAAQTLFDPIAFFSGRTAGEGELKILLKSAKPLRVQGQGRIEVDGTLVLDQQVRRGDRPAERRQWRMRKVAPNHYRGTLSDATGPVEIETRGNVLTIRYPMKGGLTVHQSLTLDNGGRTALNRMTISKLGVPVARITETIRKLD